MDNPDKDLFPDLLSYGITGIRNMGAIYDPSAYLSPEETNGSLEKGKMGDMVIPDKNPVEDIDNMPAIDEVIMAGKSIQRVYPSINEPDFIF